MGVVIPLAIAITGLLAHVPSALLLTGVACEIAGGLALRYIVLKAGAYNPLVAKAG
jgi:uncharacterized membrane protein